MKTIGSVKEDLTVEKRVSITPETVKKFVELGVSINLQNSIFFLITGEIARQQ